jgi:hypothetical protein
MDLQPTPVGLEPAQSALAEFRATQSEFTEFFGDIFDQLQGLSLDLYARQKCAEAGVGQKQAADLALAGVLEELGRSVENLQVLYGQFHADQRQSRQAWSELRGDYQRCLDDYQQLHDVRQGFQKMAGEFSGIKDELKHVRGLLESLNCQPRGDPIGEI